MALQHFSHDHPLVLNEVLVDKTDDNSVVEEVLCNGCRKPIIPGDFAYSCCDGCHFFLHRKCAELPKEIKHPMHEKHILTLLAVPPYPDKTFCCDVCQFNSSGFLYLCRLCDFGTDLNCAFEERSFRHEGHDHELTLIQRPASFHCDACASKAEDISYRCTICPFWIHKSCASTNTIYPSFHNHPLTLSYFIPELYRTFTQYCNICKKQMNPFNWLYMCGGCRIFTHIKCATSTSNESLSAGPMMFRDGKSEIEADDQRDLDPNQVKFPVLDESSLDLIMRQFIEGISLEAKEINILEVREPFTLWSTIRMRKNETEVDEDRDLQKSKFGEESDTFTHFIHMDHPLILQNNNKDNESDKMLICNGCVKHILGDEYPYYACLQCNFVLHRTCAKLPQELKHSKFHPEHHLKHDEYPYAFDFQICSACNSYSNGFFYCCESCDIYIDLKCATLPSTIKHEAHKHPLVQSILLVTDREVPCMACCYWIDGMEYRCEACDFHVHSKCATSFPSKVIHKWDDHPIPLVYGSVQDHPDVFYCEICEEEINPRYWLYFFRECDRSFHPLCLYPDDGFENIKFGSKHKLDSHPHSLTFIRSNKGHPHSLTSLRYQSANKYPSTCDSCKIWSNFPVFECAPCNFVLCMSCVSEISGDSE